MVKEFSGDYFQWLRGFYHVAQTGSVSAAARILDLRQPTISHQIKSLEETYRVTLFDRSSGGMALTPEGLALLDHVVSVFDNVENISDRLTRMMTEIKGRIAIASTHALIMYFLAPHVIKFQKAHPEISFELIGGMLDSIERGVDSGSVDFGVVYLDSVGGNYDIHFLFNSSMSLITEKANRLNIYPGMSIKEIAKLPFIGFPSNSTIKALVDEKFRKNGCQINDIIVSNNFETTKTFVKSGLGVSIIFDYGISKWESDQLFIVSLYEHFGKIPIGVITRKRKYIGPGAKTFLNELISYKY